MLAAAVRFLPVVATLIAFAAPGGAWAASAGGQPAWEESGMASWYGGRHQGRRTSSGEAFDPNGMTAAHPSLPLGSHVRVTMQDTGESVVVRITDRQPRHGVRVIDLSRAAAGRIGLLGRGTGWVTLSHAGAAEAEELEVAEAPVDDGADAYDAVPSPRRRGRLHTRRARP